MKKLVTALMAIAGVLVAGSFAYATTYNTPTVDGTISISASDWDANELVVDDPSNDSYWGASNEIDNLYLTWDADNLYIGVDYTVSGNAMVVYLHIGGSAWYSDTDMYNMDFYKRNFRFRSGHGAQIIIGGWDGGTPGIHGVTGDNTSSDIGSSCTISGAPGSGIAGSTEIEIPWNTLYGLGAGVVPANAVVEAVAVIAGGDNWGSPDSAPDNADCNGDGGPDSLIALHMVNVDHNWDGTPELNWNPATNSSNLLLNAGFESWTNGPSADPDNWLTETSGVFARQEASTVHSGSYSTKLKLTSTSTQQFIQVINGITPGTSYSFKFYVLDNDATCRARVCIRWYDNLGALISGYYGSYSSDSPSWQLLDSGSQPAPSGAVDAHAEIRLYDTSGFADSAFVYVDNASFAAAAPPSPSPHTVYDIQYTTDPSGDSPYKDSLVVTSGIVTAGSGVFSGGYFIQDGSGPWNGIYIYDNTHTVSEGDDITLIGTVTEYSGKTEISNVTSMVINSSGNALPAASVVTTNTVNTSEAYEGVLVKVGDVVVTNPSLGYGEWEINDGSGPCRVDDWGSYSYTPTMDDSLNVTGVVDYAYGDYKVEPRYDADIERLGHPSEVWVDDDYCNGCANDGHTWGYNAFDNIQEGIDSLLSAGTVNVKPGSYMEAITIGKPLTLQSTDGYASTFIYAPTSGYVAEIVLVDSVDNAVIDGFTIDGGTNQANVHYGVRYYKSGGEIKNNLIQYIEYASGNNAGMRLTASGANATSNTIQYYWKIGLILSHPGTNGTVSGNTIIGDDPNVIDQLQDGIQIGYGATPTITGNEIYGNTNSYSGHYWASHAVVAFEYPAYGPTGTVANISGNNFHNNEEGIEVGYTGALYWWGIPDHTIAYINGNTLTGNEFTIYQGNLTTATIEGNTLTGSGTGSYGYNSWEKPVVAFNWNTVSDFEIGFYTDDSTTNTCYLNTFSGNGTGMYVSYWGGYGHPMVTAHYDNFTGNTSYGFNCDDAAIVVDAEYNWWNDPAGPTPPGPKGGIGSSKASTIPVASPFTDGSKTSLKGPGRKFSSLGKIAKGAKSPGGDAVSDYVDYDPWLCNPSPPPNLVGDCESELGGSDWNNGDLLTMMPDIPPCDNIYEVTLVATGNFPWTEMSGYQVVDTAGLWSPQYPGQNVPIEFSTGNTVTFYLDKNVYSDGFVPTTNIVYDSKMCIPKVGPYYVVGACQTEFGASGDWNSSDTTMKMTDEDVDLVYTYQGICSTAGSYDFKVLNTYNSWRPQYTGIGYVWDYGPNLSFSVPHNGQMVKFETDIAKGRTRVSIVNQDPVIVQPADTTIDEGQHLIFVVNASDVDCDSIALQGEDLPSGATFPTVKDSASVASTFDWTPNYGQGDSIYTVKFIATDDGSPILADTIEVTITVNDVDQPPMISATYTAYTIEDLCEEGCIPTDTITAFDPDTLDKDDVILVCLNPPVGATFTLAKSNPAVGYFDWCPAPNQADSTYVIRFEAQGEHSKDLYDTLDVTITVKGIITEVNLGDTVSVWPGADFCIPINITNGVEIGGYDFLLHYDPSVLTVTDVTDSAGLEYFNWSSWQVDDGQKLRIIGIANKPNDVNTPPIPPGCSQEVAEVCFHISAKWDPNYQVPIDFEVDNGCVDNTISNGLGTELWTSLTRYYWQGTHYFHEQVKPCEGMPGTIVLKGTKVQGVDIQGPYGDVNYDGIAFTIADAVYFMEYLKGTVELSDPEYQGTASDVNLDGHQWTIADLIYLVNIVNGSAQRPGGGAKVVPEAVNLTVKGGTVSVDKPIAGLYLIVKGGGELELKASGMEMQTETVNGERRILIIGADWENQTATATGDLVTIPGEFQIREVQVSDADGWLMATKLVLIPTQFALYQNYPNPFNPTTRISFDLPEDEAVSLTIYNISGQKVTELVNGEVKAGHHTVSWDGAGVSSGVYFYRITAGNFTATRKMVLMK